MSQKAEKYARNMERRVKNLEETMEMVKKSLINHAPRLNKVEDVVEGHTEKLWDIETAARHEVDMRRSEWTRTRQRITSGWEWPRRFMVYQWAALLIIAVLIFAALIMAVKAARANRPKPEAIQPAAAETAQVEVKLLSAELAGSVWDLAAQYRAAEDPAEADRIVEALLSQEYFSAEIPLSWEHQDHMRTYCHLYGCPYPLALAVADWETRGRFNMDAMGPAGEVGIFQLNPGPDGAYHAELEAATGLDPTTPEGNIAGGCYLLGKYLARYEDTTMTAMAYNMGQAGAERAQEAGIVSTRYTDAVLTAMERWGTVVTPCIGE